MRCLRFLSLGSEPIPSVYPLITQPWSSYELSLFVDQLTNNRVVLRIASPTRNSDASRQDGGEVRWHELLLKGCPTR